MEMCYAGGAFAMPSNYTLMSEEEMTYVEGGWNYTYSKNDIAVPIKAQYLSKWVCMAFADYVVLKHGKWGLCNGMNVMRIAAELFSHAVAYYSADSLIGIGLKSEWIKDIRRCGKVANIGLGDGLGLAYYTIWSYVPG